MDQEALWSLLLDSIEDGRVVPIVGAGLLTIPGGDGDVPYYSELARRLALEVDVEEDRGFSPDLNAVACLYMKKGGRLEDLYSILQRVADDKTLPVPKALWQLARIPNFRLFMTTTFDSLLVRAINDARAPTVANVLSFSLSKPQDLSSAPAADPASTVYHLFGKFSPRPGSYALTQEDVLEFMYAMQSEKRPASLYKELADNSLLILGNRFSGWLARFFLRLIRRERLAVATKSPSFIAEPEISSDKGMTLFVENFSRDTRIFPSAGPVEFVDELCDRWFHLHPEAAEPSGAPTSKGSSDPFIFMSYADEDRDCAERIERALDQSGISVFFDKDRDGLGLQGGDNWDIKLRKKIRSCSLFMPILSEHVLTPDNRYFRSEWRMGIESFEQSAAFYSDKDVYLLPIAIDGTSKDAPRIPPEFLKPQWIQLPGGLPTSGFVTRVKELYRARQEARVGGR